MHIVLSDTRPNELADCLADRGEHVKVRSAPWFDHSRLVNLAADLADRGEVTSVSTMEERYVPTAALLRTLLRLPGTPWALARQATDKALMRDQLVTAGLPVVPYRRVDALHPAELSDLLAHGPLVVKPRLSTAVPTAERMATPEDLDRLTPNAWFTHRRRQSELANTTGGFLIELALDTDAEYHIEILRHNGRTVYALPGRFHEPALGTRVLGSAMLSGQEPHAEHVVQLALRAADALGLSTGFAHVRLVRTRGGAVYISDFSLQPGGPQIRQMLALAHGLDITALAADLAMGLPPQAAVRPDAPAVAWAGITAPRGLVTHVTSSQAIRAMPGVIEATTSITPGDLSAGPTDDSRPAASVYTAATTADQAAAQARAAAEAWQIHTLDLQADEPQLSTYDRTLGATHGHR